MTTYPSSRLATQPRRYGRDAWPSALIGSTHRELLDTLTGDFLIARALNAVRAAPSVKVRGRILILSSVLSVVADRAISDPRRHREQVNRTVGGAPS